MTNNLPDTVVSEFPYVAVSPDQGTGLIKFGVEGEEAVIDFFQANEIAGALTHLFASTRVGDLRVFVGSDRGQPVVDLSVRGKKALLNAEGTALLRSMLQQAAAEVLPGTTTKAPR